jgi:hypothetical protein
MVTAHHRRPNPTHHRHMLARLRRYCHRHFLLARTLASWLAFRWLIRTEAGWSTIRNCRRLFLLAIIRASAWELFTFSCITSPTPTSKRLVHYFLYLFPFTSFAPFHSKFSYVKIRVCANFDLRRFFFLLILSVLVLSNKYCVFPKQEINIWNLFFLTTN